MCNCISGDGYQQQQNRKHQETNILTGKYDHENGKCSHTRKNYEYNCTFKKFAVIEGKRASKSFAVHFLFLCNKLRGLPLHLEYHLQGLASARTFLLYYTQTHHCTVLLLIWRLRIVLLDYCLLKIKIILFFYSRLSCARIF